MALPAVAFHPDAVAEARAARDWYAERSGLAAAAFVAELDAAVDHITRTPDAWPAYVASTRRFLLRRFPFFVIYRQDPRHAGIQVLAVAHGRRKPGYWRGRTDRPAPSAT